MGQAKLARCFCRKVNLASGAMVQDELLFLGMAADLRRHKALLLLLSWEDAPQNSPKEQGRGQEGWKQPEVLGDMPWLLPAEESYCMIFLGPLEMRPVFG